VSVAEQLGLDDEDSELLAEAQRLWPGWIAASPPLGEPPGGLAGLRTWLRVADPNRADAVLYELARIGSPTGGNSIPASALLAWALLPGASSLARRLGGLTPRIDELVAAQLWVEVRGFPWKRLRKVAANILANTRGAVLAECGVRSQVERVDRTWGRVLTQGAWWSTPSTPQEQAPDAADELLEVLDWAREQNVITDVDRSLLLSLVAAAERTPSTRQTRGQGGLMANHVSAAVAQEWGIAPGTVRRRARHTVRALADACAGGRFAA
jgi:hypothetical protein